MEYEISAELKEKCNDLWDIYTDMPNIIKAKSDEIGYSNITEYCLENFNRYEMIGYHLGNIYPNESPNQAFKWALENCTNKIKALNHYVDEGRFLTLEAANRCIKDCRDILDAVGKDELLYAYINNEYEFWDSLPDEELYSI